ncbi:6637_t:CDS:2, partial [Funneliformis geosporum]
ALSAIISYLEVEHQKRLSNLNPEEAENLKFDQERSIINTMTLKCYDEKSVIKELEAKDIVQ